MGDALQFNTRASSRRSTTRRSPSSERIVHRAANACARSCCTRRGADSASCTRAADLPRDATTWLPTRATNKSWDFTVDRDGTIYQQNDPARFFTWHAGAANPFSVGIEMVQALSGDLYEAQVRAAVELIESLSAAFGLARLLPWRRGAPDLRVLPTVRAGRLDRLHGLFAHANFTDDRGPGDPGPIAFRVLQGVMGWVGVEWTESGAQ